MDWWIYPESAYPEVLGRIAKQFPTTGGGLDPEKCSFCQEAVLRARMAEAMKEESRRASGFGDYLWEECGELSFTVEDYVTGRARHIVYETMYQVTSDTAMGWTEDWCFGGGRWTVDLGRLVKPENADE
jgi:hypothetical protein